jgi:hypothetical protein
MANQLGALKVAPRCHLEHDRHDEFSRDRHSKQLNAFLTEQALRLSSNAETIFLKVQKYGAERVKAATNISQLP